MRSRLKFTNISKLVSAEAIYLEDGILFPIHRYEIEKMTENTVALFGRFECIGFVHFYQQRTHFFSTDENLTLAQLLLTLPELKDKINSAKTPEEVL